MAAPLPSPPDPLDVPATRRDVLAVLARLAANPFYPNTASPAALAWEHFTVVWRGHEASAPDDGGAT